MQRYRQLCKSTSLLCHCKADEIAIDQGFTPLHLATDRGHTQIVQYLLDRGADRSIQDSEGATALDTARILENKELILILED